MKTHMTKLLGVDIKVHNHREDDLVSITRNNALNVLQWLDEESDSEIINGCSEEKRHRIAKNITSEVDSLFTAMYYMGMIKEPVCIDLYDIISWNGND